MLPGVILTVAIHVHKLQVLQKRALRLITNSPYRSPSIPLFLQLHCLPFNELVSLNALIFMHKLHVSTSPSLFSDLSVKNSDVHSHNTRQKKLTASTSCSYKCCPQVIVCVYL